MSERVENVRTKDLRPGDVIVSGPNGGGWMDSYAFWTVEREESVPPPPTEPGYYLTTKPDYGGGPVVVELLNSPAEQWVDAGDREYLNRKQVEDLLPLVRLEPRAVTAKAVLERVADVLPKEGRVLLVQVAREFKVASDG